MDQKFNYDFKCEASDPYEACEKTTFTGKSEIGTGDNGMTIIGIQSTFRSTYIAPKDI